MRSRFKHYEAIHDRLRSLVYSLLPVVCMGLLWTVAWANAYEKRVSEALTRRHPQSASQSAIIDRIWADRICADRICADRTCVDQIDTREITGAE